MVFLTFIGTFVVLLAVGAAINAVFCIFLNAHPDDYPGRLVASYITMAVFCFAIAFMIVWEAGLL